MSSGGKRPGAGRPSGAHNKHTIEIAEKLAALGCDPIAGMAQIAVDAKNPLDIRAKMFSELAQYVAPKRKAVEHSGDKDNPVALGMVMLPPKTG